MVDSNRQIVVSASVRITNLTLVAFIRVAVRRPRIMCPANILAASRRARVSGRARTLISSISPITGAIHSGRSFLTRETNFFIGFDAVARTAMSHRGSASAAVNTRWLDTLIVQGISPVRFVVVRSRKRDASSHLMP